MKLAVVIDELDKRPIPYGISQLRRFRKARDLGEISQSSAAAMPDRSLNPSLAPD
jgi:hypothetical protein